MAYSGEVAKIPIGEAGVVSDMPPSKIPYTALTRAYNCSFGLGYVQKAEGAIQYNRYAFPITNSLSVVAALDYWPTTQQQRMFVACSNGSIYRDTGDRYFGANAANTAPVAVASGLGSLTGKSQFVVGGNEIAGNPKRVFFFSGGLSQVQVYSGDAGTFSPITNPSADWPNPSASTNPSSFFPKFGLIYRSSLCCFAGSNLYMSNPTNHEDFQTAQTTLIAPVGPGEGGDIVGAMVYKQKLIIWKEGDFCYILNDSAASNTGWYVSKFSDGFGIAGWHSASQVQDDLLVGDITNRITSFKATLNYGDFSQADVFKQARVSRFYDENLTPIGNQFQHSLYYPRKGLALFTGRTKGRQNNDCVIQVDLTEPSTPKYGLWNHIQPDCLAKRRDTNNVPVPICGSADGYVYLLDRENRQSAGPNGSGNAYTAEFWTADLDMGWMNPPPAYGQDFAHKNKNFDWLWVTFVEEGNYSLFVDVWIDGRFRKTLTFSQTIDTNYAGAYVLGATPTGGIDEKTTPGQKIDGIGRRITLRCYNTGNNQNFKVSALTVGFRPSGEQVTNLLLT